MQEFSAELRRMLMRPPSGNQSTKYGNNVSCTHERNIFSVVSNADEGRNNHDCLRESNTYNICFSFRELYFIMNGVLLRLSLRLPFF